MPGMIYKYTLPQEGAFTLQMPPESKVLKLDLQAGQPRMWVLFPVDRMAERESRGFAVLGTGHAVPDGAEHVGTWQAPPYVWHLFELKVGR